MMSSLGVMLPCILLVVLRGASLTSAYRVVINDVSKAPPTHDPHLVEYLNYKAADDINCTTFVYETADCTEDDIQVCYPMAGAHWYGGTAIRDMQWPIEKWTKAFLPYVPGDGYTFGYGGMLERYWFNSAGLGLYVDWESPLWLAVNNNSDGLFCLMARYLDSPYFNPDRTVPTLNYTHCTGRDVRHIHDYMTSSYLPRPTDIPDRRLIEAPIWSTWAQYHKDIDQQKVLEFANAIIENGFDSSQVEIDDRWETFYGDLDFDPVKFPDPLNMTSTLHAAGLRVTLWVHPFVNLDSPAMFEGVDRRVFVADPARIVADRRPALTIWWAGDSAMTVDFTDPEAAEWFGDRLTALRTSYGIDSFKFDAGEVNWLPNCYQLAQPNRRNPGYYTSKYAELAYQMDTQVRHQEVRVGAQSQHLPVFVRMMDKDSRWDWRNGLATVIPHALVSGLVGYPFVLPDMIGGNAYGALPDRELFIRWTQLNVFLPSVQFSIVPWQYDAELIDIVKDMLAIRERYASTLIELAVEATETGAPIVRPLWWISPTDENALSIDSQFLVGNAILVAPVIVQGATSRDIYLPAGVWRDELRGGAHLQGQQWLLEYTVQLNELAYFTLVQT